MKQHVFGIAIFAIIIVSFAFLFALFKLEIVPVPEVLAPAPSSDLAVRVQSSYYDLDNETLVTEIRLDWKGPGDAPDSVSLRRELYVADRSETVTYKRIEQVIRPFRGARTATVKLEARDYRPDSPDANLYIRVSAGRERPDSRVEVAPVLFVHGERSRPRS